VRNVTEGNAKSKVLRERPGDDYGDEIKIKVYKN
jgi:hypothetical protein